jgi:hypothetical protein
MNKLSSWFYKWDGVPLNIKGFKKGLYVACFVVGCISLVLFLLCTMSKTGNAEFWGNLTLISIFIGMFIVIRAFSIQIKQLSKRDKN